MTRSGLWRDRDLWAGLLAAAPLVVFPFSRAYTICFLLILAVALVANRRPGPWLRHPGLLLAGAATGLPILLTMVVAGFRRGGIDGLWVEKLALVGVAALVGLAVALLLDGARARRVAALVITATVALWVVDGLVQLLAGRDLFGVPLANEVGGPPRVRSFFSKSTRYSYFVGFLLIPPAFWLLGRPRGRLPACLLVACGAAAVFAAGSRYAMAGYGLFMIVFVAVVARGLPKRPRVALLVGAPVALLSLVALMYFSNDSFRTRLDQTAVVLEQFDRETVNRALSMRLDVWEPAVEMIAERWAFGWGPSEFERQVGAYLDADSPFAGETRIMHAHQVGIEVLLATGLVGLGAFLAYYAWLTRTLWLRRERAASFGWGCLLAYLLLWFPLGSQKDFYGSEQVLVSFYLLGLGFACLAGEGAATRMERPGVTGEQAKYEESGDDFDTA